MTVQLGQCRYRALTLFTWAIFAPNILSSEAGGRQWRAASVLIGTTYSNNYGGPFTQRAHYSRARRSCGQGFLMDSSMLMLYYRRRNTTPELGLAKLLNINEAGVGHLMLYLNAVRRNNRVK